MLYLFGTGVTSMQMASYPRCVFDEWDTKDHPTHSHARCFKLGSKTSMGLLRPIEVEVGMNPARVIAE